MRKVLVKVKQLHPDAVLPPSGRGPLEIGAVEEVILAPGVPALVKTGLSIELAPGYSLKFAIQPELAFERGVSMLSAMCQEGGELKLFLLWGGHRPNAVDRNNNGRYRIDPGDCIAQMVVSRYEEVEWNREVASI